MRSMRVVQHPPFPCSYRTLLETEKLAKRSLVGYFIGILICLFCGGYLFASGQPVWVGFIAPLLVALVNGGRTLHRLYEYQNMLRKYL